MNRSGFRAAPRRPHGCASPVNGAATVFSYGRMAEPMPCQVPPTSPRDRLRRPPRCSAKARPSQPYSRDDERPEIVAAAGQPTCASSSHLSSSDVTSVDLREPPASGPPTLSDRVSELGVFWHTSARSARFLNVQFCKWPQLSPGERPRTQGRTNRCDRRPRPRTVRGVRSSDPLGRGP